MKEVTEWNGKPRYMWCWDKNEDVKVKDYVVCILTDRKKKETGADYSVVTAGSRFLHCAEIEEEPTRLTNYELSQLLKCFGVDYTWGCMSSSHNSEITKLVEENEELPDSYKIRYKQGEWEEPTRETVFEWWRKENDGSDISRFISFMGWFEKE